MQTVELTGIVTIGGDEPRIGGTILTERLRKAFPSLGPLTACVATGGPEDLYDDRVGPGETPGPIFTFSETLDMWVCKGDELNGLLAALDGQLVHVRVDAG